MFLFLPLNSGPCNSFSRLEHFKHVYDDIMMIMIMMIIFLSGLSLLQALWRFCEATLADSKCFVVIIFVVGIFAMVLIYCLIFLSEREFA